MGAQQKPEAEAAIDRDNGAELRRTPGYKVGWLEGKLAAQKVLRDREQAVVEQKQELDRIQRELFRLRAEVGLNQESAANVEKLTKELERHQTAMALECQRLVAAVQAQTDRQSCYEDVLGPNGQGLIGLVDEVRQLVARQQHEAEKALFQQQALETQRQRGLEALRELEGCKDQLLALSDRTQDGLAQVGIIGSCVEQALQAHEQQAVTLASQGERIEAGLQNLAAQETGLAARLREGQDSLREATALMVTVQAEVTAESERREAWRTEWLLERGQISQELQVAHDVVDGLLGQVRAQAGEQARWQADNRALQERISGLTNNLTNDREQLLLLREAVDGGQISVATLLTEVRTLAGQAGAQLADAKVQYQAVSALRQALDGDRQEVGELRTAFLGDREAWRAERDLAALELKRWQGMATELEKRCDQFSLALQAAQDAEREARAELFSGQATQRALLAERETLAAREVKQQAHMTEWQALLQDASLQAEQREQLLREQAAWLETARVRETELLAELTNTRTLLQQERDAVRHLADERAKWQALAEAEVVERQRHAEVLSALQQERTGWTTVLKAAERGQKVALEAQESLRRELKEAGITNRELRLASQEMRQQVEQLRNGQQLNREELLAMRQEVRGVSKELEELGGFAEELEGALGQQARKAEVEGLVRQVRDLGSRVDGQAGEMMGMRQVVELVLRSADAGAHEGKEASEKRRPWFATRA